MGLKKPVKTGSDLPTINELVGVDAVPVEADGYIVLDTVPGQACAMESNTPISIKAELGKFGDATAADVVSGKTFTSATGLKVAGTGYLLNDKKMTASNLSSGSWAANDNKTLTLPDGDCILICRATTSSNIGLYYNMSILTRISGKVMIFNGTSYVQPLKNATVDGNIVTIPASTSASSTVYFSIESLS